MSIKRMKRTVIFFGCLMAVSLLQTPLYAGSLTILKYFNKKTVRKVPFIRVSYENNEGVSYRYSSSLLREKPIFRIYNEEFFNQNLLPENIKVRNGNDIIECSYLTQLLENLINEIKDGKQKFTDFTVIASSTFNFKLRAGALVVKAKKYPFVIKVFIQTPYSFTHPLSMGLESYAIARMGGGINRHIAGFTRISNLKNIQDKITVLEKSFEIDFPRKWFWKPESDVKLKIEGFNFPLHQDENLNICIPSIYCVIADAIDAEKTFSLLNKYDRILSFDFFNAMQNCIDPNPNNFMREKQTGATVLIDTEHWPSLIGVTKKPNISCYASYYLLFGTLHCLHNFIFGMKDSCGKSFDDK